MQCINGKYVNGSSAVRRVNTGANGSISSGSITQTATGTISGPYSMEEATAVAVTVIVTAVSGTAPTLVINLQDAATVGGSYGTEQQLSTTAISAVGTYTGVMTIRKPFVKMVSTIGGTTPSFTFEVQLTPFVVINGQ